MPKSHLNLISFMTRGRQRQTDVAVLRKSKSNQWTVGILIPPLTPPPGQNTTPADAATGSYKTLCWHIKYVLPTFKRTPRLAKTHTQPRQNVLYFFLLHTFKRAHKIPLGRLDINTAKMNATTPATHKSQAAAQAGGVVVGWQ